jgi:hypothetical protein
MKTLLGKLAAFGAVASLAIGCAQLPGDREQTCANAIAAYEVYRAVIAAGDKPSKEQVLAAAAAGAFLQVNCGYTAPVVKSGRVAIVPVDSNGVLILQAPK